MDMNSDSRSTMTQPQFERRQYQVELIEQIKQMKNAILFLPTGSGKTFIALEIIKHMQEDLQKPILKGGKRTIFLANTIALVEQHYLFLKKHCCLQITMLTGDQGADIWKPNEWSDIENNSQILIMTSQIYVNALTHGYLYLRNANLLVFDECHHAVNKHPMREVMKFFEKCKKNVPKVLGLSATLINCNTSLEGFNEQLELLENTFRSKIITSSRVAEVKKFSTKAKERNELLISYQSPPKITNQIKELVKKHVEILEKLKLKDDVRIPRATDRLMNDRGENRLKLLRNCLSDLMVHLEEFGLYFCYIGCTFYINQLERIMNEKSNEQLYCNALLIIITLLKAIRKLLAVEIARSGDIKRIDVIAENCAVKLGYLLKQLRNFSPSDKCIVFVERRMTANILFKIIQTFFKEIKSQLVVSFMVGFSHHPLRNFREDEFDRKDNRKVMTNFRSGLINILVASNVLEEGIDMPDCNTVFMYDFPKTFRSYVQSKGRARKEDSRYVLLLDKDHEKCMKNIDDFRELEKKLANVVPLFDISAEFSNGEKSRIEISEETYTTLSGATVTKTQAIPIIDIYCSSLPHDIFTQLTPNYWQNIKDGGYICKLQFPMNAAIKKIVEGPVCNSIKEAKQAVAFEAVKILHRMQALNDNLIPISAPLTEDEDEYYWFPHWRTVDCNAGDGIKSSKKEITMKVPKYLENCRPIANETCYLHVINIFAKYPIPTSHRRKMCDRLLTSYKEFGIITRRPIPKISDFPVFSDLGEIEISIDTNHRSLQLTENQLIQVSKFHRILFLKAIEIVKKYLVYSQDNDESMGYFIVPLKPREDRHNMMEISFEVISNQWNIFDVEEPSEKERKEESYTKQNYLGHVVVPWYQKHHNKETERTKYYVITDVDKNCNLASPFPNKKYVSYADYYERVHNLKSLQPDQPLMEARPIPINLDCLRPRAISGDKSEKKGAKEYGIYVVPEFCMKQIFPSNFWYKATVLPTILHRFHYLLLAEEIREKIVVEGGIGTLKWTKDENDVLKVIDKYNIKKSPNNQPLVESKKSSLKTTERYTSQGNKSVLGKYVNDFEDLPSLMTLEEHRNYEGPRQKDIFEALTPKGCNDILDLERLETLGDSFLKFAVSFTIFVKYSTVNEGYLTTLKSRLVGNRNLMYCGNKLNLETFIKANTFSANNWCPPGFTLPHILKEIRSITPPHVIFHVNIPFDERFSGIISKKTISNMRADVKKFLTVANNPEIRKQESAALSFFGKQLVSDKTIADVIEALVGVYVKTGGIKPAYQLLNYFGIIANPKYHEVIGTRIPSPLFENSKNTINELIPNYKKLEKLLSYEFRDKAFIVQALSHPSYLKNDMTDCYQTSEFIGDAVLDFLITSYIYQYCGDLPPGKLTDLRASLVNNNTFGALCVRLGLHKFLLSNNQKLTEAINRFVDYQQKRNYEIHGNEMMILISESDVKMAEEVEVPKVLGDVFESLAGAIFLDSGNDLKAVWRVYYNIMRNEIEKFSENIPINPVRALYEVADLTVKFITETSQPTEDVKLRKFIEGKMTIKLSVTRNNKEFIYFGRGENSDLCKRAAAKLALRDLIGRTDFVI